jgi:hypothetical protein
VPGCNHSEHDGTVFFHQKCHPGGKVEVSYTQGGGQLKITCTRCGRRIALVSVARKEAP